MNTLLSLLNVLIDYIKAKDVINFVNVETKLYYN